mgnify:CR=1 FL=1
MRFVISLRFKGVKIIAMNEGKSPEFITLEEAAKMTTGTRVTFIPGMQALYAEALKNVCYVKKIPLIRALHPLMGVDKETGKDRQEKLYELTSQTSLPTMFHNGEHPRSNWTEQLALAERAGTSDSPILIPDDFRQRVEMFGLCAIILAEDGLVWNMRILSDGPLGRKYGYSAEASAQAPNKMSQIVRVIDSQLQAQEERGSKYLVGDAISAADVYWATMSMAVIPASPEIMPRTKQNAGLLAMFAASSQIPQLKEAITDRLEKQRDYILTTYCETPAVLGGDPI